MHYSQDVIRYVIRKKAGKLSLLICFLYFNMAEILKSNRYLLLIIH